MTQKQAIQLFEDRKVRTVWDERTETWYFSVLDVISALTDTVNPTDYFKKMRKRDEALASFVGTNCPQIAMRSETGVMRKTLAGDVKTVLRIIQSIPSQKAEPFKQWMAQVASDRLDQMQDPELSIEQAVADYKRLGYSDTWINQRLKSIEVRKLLTDEWKRGGVDGTQYATLTDIITKVFSFIVLDFYIVASVRRTLPLSSQCKNRHERWENQSYQSQVGRSLDAIRTRSISNILPLCLRRRSNWEIIFSMGRREKFISEDMTGA